MADTNEYTSPEAPERLDVELKDISSTALDRLVDEVRNESGDNMASETTYNRTYHRHNR